ncbi:MAG: sugar phosphate isomerase/epimerase [Clostridia bacterium]|nr:sugar phosphate isomerase/epimerase [Clostridia bacterium]MBR5366182.1 sugar phosphate isomerase/epimerase [Clostridia bacterium]
MKYGIQMYSLRDITPSDLDGALKAVADMGYEMVEFAGFFGHSAEDVKAMLDKYGLVCSGTHSGLYDLLNDFEGTVKYHKTIGNHNYIIPGHDLSTKEKLDTFIAQVNEIAPKLRAEGIELGYHNHSHEFYDMPEGYQIHRELEARADLFFEIDTYWAYVAKQDPIATLERLRERVPVIHLKDGDADGHGVSLGQGTAPVAEVRKKAIEYGMQIVVESEGLDPTGREEVQRCIDFLHAEDKKDAE